jgi:hypothetical protein
MGRPTPKEHAGHGHARTRARGDSRPTAHATAHSPRHAGHVRTRAYRVGSTPLDVEDQRQDSEHVSATPATSTPRSHGQRPAGLGPDSVRVAGSTLGRGLKRSERIAYPTPAPFFTLAPTPKPADRWCAPRGCALIVVIPLTVNCHSHFFKILLGKRDGSCATRKSVYQFRLIGSRQTRPLFCGIKNLCKNAIK